ADEAIERLTVLVGVGEDKVARGYGRRGRLLIEHSGQDRIVRDFGKTVEPRLNVPEPPYGKARDDNQERKDERKSGRDLDPNLEIGNGRQHGNPLPPAMAPHGR